MIFRLADITFEVRSSNDAVSPCAEASLELSRVAQFSPPPLNAVRTALWNKTLSERYVLDACLYLHQADRFTALLDFQGGTGRVELRQGDRQGMGQARNALNWLLASAGIRLGYHLLVGETVLVGKRLVWFIGDSYAGKSTCIRSLLGTDAGGVSSSLTLVRGKSVIGLDGKGRRCVSGWNGQIVPVLSSIWVEETSHFFELSPLKAMRVVEEVYRHEVEWNAVPSFFVPVWKALKALKLAGWLGFYSGTNSALRRQALIAGLPEAPYNCGEPKRRRHHAKESVSYRC